VCRSEIGDGQIKTNRCYEKFKSTANDKLFQLEQLMQPVQLDIDDRQRSAAAATGN